jgi:hypothetical protein
VTAVDKATTFDILRRELVMPLDFLSIVEANKIQTRSGVT